jgi:GT2 family glycosyltransferase
MITGCSAISSGAVPRPSDMPRVVIIILNWNGWKDTIECLESLWHINYPDYRVVVVDNKSEDGSIERIVSYCDGKIPVYSPYFNYDPDNKPIRYKRLTKDRIDRRDGDISVPGGQDLIIIENDKNYGFALGNNIAIEYARETFNPDYILFLNNDTVVESMFLRELVDTAEANKKIGIVGSINYYYYDPMRVWYSGGTINWVTGKSRDDTQTKIDTGYFQRIRPVDDVAGSSLLIRTEVLDRIGYFYPGYFFYYEETDLCVKAKKNGYLVYANLNSRIWHKIGASSKKMSVVSQYHLTRNRILFMRRNARRLEYALFIMVLILYSIPVSTFSSLVFSKDLKILRSYYQAIYNGLLYKL